MLVRSHVENIVGVPSFSAVHGWELAKLYTLCHLFSGVTHKTELKRLQLPTMPHQNEHTKNICGCDMMLMKFSNLVLISYMESNL